MDYKDQYIGSAVRLLFSRFSAWGLLFIGAMGCLVPLTFLSMISGPFQLVWFAGIMIGALFYSFLCQRLFLPDSGGEPRGDWSIDDVMHFAGKLVGAVRDLPGGSWKIIAGACVIALIIGKAGALALVAVLPGLPAFWSKAMMLPASVARDPMEVSTRAMRRSKPLSYELTAASIAMAAILLMAAVLLDIMFVSGGGDEDELISLYFIYQPVVLVWLALANALICHVYRETRGEVGQAAFVGRKKTFGKAKRKANKRRRQVWKSAATVRSGGRKSIEDALERVEEPAPEPVTVEAVWAPQPEPDLEPEHEQAPEPHPEPEPEIVPAPVFEPEPVPASDLKPEQPAAPAKVPAKSPAPKDRTDGEESPDETTTYVPDWKGSSKWSRSKSKWDS